MFKLPGVHTVADALKDTSAGGMAKLVKDRRGNICVFVEDPGPLLEGLVRCQDDNTPLVSPADDLEEQDGGFLIDRQISELVQNQQHRAQMLLRQPFFCAPCRSLMASLTPANNSMGLAFDAARKPAQASHCQRRDQQHEYLHPPRHCPRGFGMQPNP